MGLSQSEAGCPDQKVVVSKNKFPFLCTNNTVTCTGNSRQVRSRSITNSTSKQGNEICLCSTSNGTQCFRLTDMPSKSNCLGSICLFLRRLFSILDQPGICHIAKDDLELLTFFLLSLKYHQALFMQCLFGIQL